MKKILLSILLCLPLSVVAQSNWETVNDNQQKASTRQKAQPTTGRKKEYQYARYLGNVVPMVNGEVMWEKTFDNNLSAEANYEHMLKFLTQMTQEDNQLEDSKVAIVNKTEHKIVCHFDEWLVFSNKFLALDRTRMIYTLTCDCYDNKVDVKIFRISYRYEEQRDGGEIFKAEEWITDENAVNKKRTRLLKISGKFRRCTVDRMEQILNTINHSLKK